MHFNKNRNIYISNLRDNYVMVHNGKKWEIRNRKVLTVNIFIIKNYFVKKNDLKICDYNKP